MPAKRWAYNGTILIWRTTAARSSLCLVRENPDRQKPSERNRPAHSHGSYGDSEEPTGAMKPNPEGFLFVTRNGRPPSSNKVVEYHLWTILDALGIRGAASTHSATPHCAPA